jgi:hypothetical protein
MARADRHTKMVSDVAAQAIGGVEFRACLEPINETTNMADVRRTSASRVAILESCERTVDYLGISHDELVSCNSPGE